MVDRPRNAEELFDPEREPAPAVVDRPQRTNDPIALRDQAISDKAKELEQEKDLREVLASTAGRKLLARIILACGWNEPYFHPSNSVMCEISGRRSIAYQIERWASDADLKLWFAVREELEKSRPKPEKKQKPRTSL